MRGFRSAIVGLVAVAGLGAASAAAANLEVRTVAADGKPLVDAVVAAYALRLRRAELLHVDSWRPARQLFGGAADEAETCLQLSLSWRGPGPQP